MTNIALGSFHGGDDPLSQFKKDDMTPEQEEQHRIDSEKWLEEVRAGKKESRKESKLLRKELSVYLNTKNQKAALHSMRASTTDGDGGLATKLKFLKIFYEQVKNGTVNPEVIAKHPARYLCGGIDLELPLLMGARDIEIVDSGLGDSIKELESKLTNYSAMKKSSNGLYQFMFNHGKGQEQTKFKLIQENVTKSKPERKYGMILSFLGTEDIPNQLEHLVEGGYFVVDWRHHQDQYKNNKGKDGCFIYQGEK